MDEHGDVNTAAKDLDQQSFSKTMLEYLISLIVFTKANTGISRYLYEYHLVNGYSVLAMAVTASSGYQVP